MAPFVQAELLGNQGGPDRSPGLWHLFLGLVSVLSREPKDGLRDGRCPKSPKVRKAE